MIGTQIGDKQLCENDARSFLEDSVWKAWKTDYDSLMAFRKTIKGKPTEEQLVTLEMNKIWIAFYDTVLVHSAAMASHGRCVCKSCAERRQSKGIK